VASRSASSGSRPDVAETCLLALAAPAGEDDERGPEDVVGVGAQPAAVC
jgi:hypothetical protein